MIKSPNRKFYNGVEISFGYKSFTESDFLPIEEACNVTLSPENITSIINVIDDYCSGREIENNSRLRIEHSEIYEGLEKTTRELDLPPIK